MNKIVTWLILATLLISGGKTFAQKDGFSLHLSGVFPNGKFGEFDEVKDGTAKRIGALFHEQSKTGAAGTGFGLGFKYQLSIPKIDGLRFLVGAELMYNPLNGDAKDWFDDNFTSGTDHYSNEYGGYSYDYDYEVTLPKYLNVPLMVGLNYAIKLNDKINIFGEVAAGINMRLNTNTKILYEANGTSWEISADGDYNYYYEVPTIEESRYKYDNAITFAYRFGAGVTFDRISIGLHWYNLGAAKVKGKIETESDFSKYGVVQHYSEEENFKHKELSISMLTLTVGYHF